MSAIGSVIVMAGFGLFLTTVSQVPSPVGSSLGPSVLFRYV
ncbi:hypothetical protein HMPREF9621_01847 [Cutibacterium modestum HL037PA2]|nr:hypothetical protein HMPREF9621_01847 [Cutibacterium modestum HL037PA2]